MPIHAYQPVGTLPSGLSRPHCRERDVILTISTFRGGLASQP